jgi:hypothetical protein
MSPKRHANARFAGRKVVFFMCWSPIARSAPCNGERGWCKLGAVSAACSLRKVRGGPTRPIRLPLVPEYGPNLPRTPRPFLRSARLACWPCRVGCSVSSCAYYIGSYSILMRPPVSFSSSSNAQGSEANSVQDPPSSPLSTRSRIRWHSFRSRPPSSSPSLPNG